MRAAKDSQLVLEKGLGSCEGEAWWEANVEMQLSVTFREERGLILQLVRLATVRDEDGVQCMLYTILRLRMRDGESTSLKFLMSMQSEFSLEELGKVRQRPLRVDFAEYTWHCMHELHACIYWQ